MGKDITKVTSGSSCELSVIASWKAVAPMFVFQPFPPCFRFFFLLPFQPFCFLVRSYPACPGLLALPQFFSRMSVYHLLYADL